VIEERFSEGDTFLHTLDPRIKIFLAVPYAFIIALSDRLVTAGAGLLISLCLVVCARLRLKMVVRSLKVLFIFIILLWIFLPLSIVGSPVFTAGHLVFSKEGVFRALSITLKSTAIVLFSISILSTSSVFSLVHAMSHLHFPKKFIYLSFLSYRYIHVLHVEYMKLRDAMRIRGFKPKTNLHTYKTFGYLIGILLIRSYDRSERIYNAMLCRGFQGKFYLLDHFKLKKGDIAFLLIMSLLFTGIVWIEWITKIV